MSAGKPAVQFYFFFELGAGDTSITISLLTGPIFFGGPSGAAPLFDISKALPSQVDNVSSSAGAPASASLDLLNTTLTLTWGSAPGAGLYQASGYFEF